MPPIPGLLPCKLAKESGQAYGFAANLLGLDTGPVTAVPISVWVTFWAAVELVAL